jgi:hypothetical protein
VDGHGQHGQYGQYGQYGRHNKHSGYGGRVRRKSFYLRSGGGAARCEGEGTSATLGFRIVGMKNRGLQGLQVKDWRRAL